MLEKEARSSQILRGIVDRQCGYIARQCRDADSNTSSQRASDLERLGIGVDCSNTAIGTGLPSQIKSQCARAGSNVKDGTGQRLKPWHYCQGGKTLEMGIYALLNQPTVEAVLLRKRLAGITDTFYPICDRFFAHKCPALCHSYQPPPRRR